MTEASGSFAVSLPLYSGPFRALADLILDQKMDVCDISIGDITGRFLAWGAASAGGWTLEEATWFLAVCAVLLELKVGRLLPRAPAETEEDLLGGASPDLVYARSLELAAFRMAARLLGERIAAASLSVARTAGPPGEFAHLYPDVMEKVRAQDIGRVAVAVLAPPRELDLSHVTPIRASLADALRAVEEQFAGRTHARFRDLVDGCEERIEVVVRFLAVLELYRQGKVELSQAEVFGDIQVRWQPSAGGASLAEPDDDRRSAGREGHVTVVEPEDQGVEP
jgi:segregation and condensation protein A